MYLENKEFGGCINKEMKYAFILSVSRRYLLGFYALVEALQRYGHHEDLHVLYYNCITQNDLDKIRARSFDFNIVFTPLEEFNNVVPLDLNPRARRAWVCRFVKYYYMSRFEEKIVWNIWGGDILLLNNISDFFNIAETTTVIGKNFTYNRGSYSLLGKHAESDSRVPIADVPLITCDKEFLERMWLNGHSEYLKQKGRGDMRCIYNTLVELGRTDNLHLEEFECWVDPTKIRPSAWGIPSEDLPVLFKTDNDEYYLNNGIRLNAFHGPCWSKGYTQKNIYSPARKKVYEIIHEIYVTTGKIYGFDEKAFR